MKKILALSLIAALAALSGCAQSPAKMRDIDLKGMYVNGYSETLAIGTGKITSIPGEREAMAAHYEEDTAWLHPETKIHTVDIFLVGTNTVSNSTKIVEAICKAFSDIVPASSSERGQAANEPEAK